MHVLVLLLMFYKYHRFSSLFFIFFLTSSDYFQMSSLRVHWFFILFDWVWCWSSYQIFQYIYCSLQFQDFCLVVWFLCLCWTSPFVHTVPFHTCLISRHLNVSQYQGFPKGHGERGSSHTVGGGVTWRRQYHSPRSSLTWQQSRPHRNPKACPAFLWTNSPAHLQTLASSPPTHRLHPWTMAVGLPTDPTNQLSQNLWSGWLVKVFSLQKTFGKDWKMWLLLYMQIAMQSCKDDEKSGKHNTKGT